MCNKKGSILMISLWIMAILVIFAIGLGHRASINLRLARYQRDRLKATYLAKAGINRAIGEINKDDPSYDAINDKWANNKEIFENISLNENEDEFATVNYLVKNKDTQEEEFIYGVMDEESKININKASSEQLWELFLFAGLAEPEATNLKDIFADWIDSDSETEPGKEIFKNGSLRRIEELLFILEYFYMQSGKERKESQKKTQEIYSKVQDLITVYGDDNKININTVSGEVLTILADSVAENVEQEGCVSMLVDEITKLRDEKIRDNPNDVPFHNNSEIIIPSLTGPCNGLLTNLTSLFTFSSRYFRIQSTGKVGQITKKINPVVKRGTPVEIISWHEN